MEIPYLERSSLYWNGSQASGVNCLLGAQLALVLTLTTQLFCKQHLNSQKTQHIPLRWTIYSDYLGNIYEDVCARSRYEGQGQVITSPQHSTYGHVIRASLCTYQDIEVTLLMSYISYYNGAVLYSAKWPLDIDALYLNGTTQDWF